MFSYRVFRTLYQNSYINTLDSSKMLNPTATGLSSTTLRSFNSTPTRFGLKILNRTQFGLVTWKRADRSLFTKTTLHRFLTLSRHFPQKLREGGIIALKQCITNYSYIDKTGKKFLKFLFKLKDTLNLTNTSSNTKVVFESVDMANVVLFGKQVGANFLPTAPVILASSISPSAVLDNMSLDTFRD